jgi:hypothetical protein
MTPDAVLVNYLEQKGLLPEYSPNKTRFRHPQRLSRVVIISSSAPRGFSVSFSQAPEEFSENWGLSPEGEIPIHYGLEETKTILDDFIRVALETPPANAAPFEERLKQVEEVINRYAQRHQRCNNYELGYDDLRAVAMEKAYAVWLHYGDKPKYEFQCLVVRSIERRFSSLLSRYYVSKRRAGAEVVNLSDEMGDLIPEPLAEIEKINPSNWEEYLNTLSLSERALIESVLHPPPVLLRDNLLNGLRFNRVNNQSPKSRIPLPKYNLKKIAAVTAQSTKDLRAAYDKLTTLIPNQAWDDLIEEPKNE